MSKALFVSGGGAASSGGTAAPAVGAAAGTGAAAATGGGGQAGFGLGSAWGVVSVVFILMNAVKRLTPIALQPFSRVSRQGEREGGGVRLLFG